MSKLKIGVLGSGDVGRVLGSGFAALGHDVKLGSRDPKSEKVAAWVEKTGAHASAGTFAEAAAFGDALILATLWSGTESALQLAGADNLAGKPLMDATNPLAFSGKGPPTLAIGHTDSAGEQVQRWAPKANVVKCFNIVGNPHMVNPTFPVGAPDMFICGDDEGAKSSVTALCKELGWPTIDMGGIEASRLLEPLALIWIQYYFRTGSGNHAISMLRK
jgi:predicted dinucleotide-binding enzyme